MKNKVTQSDIAKKLNISRNTISKVFNNEPGVSEAMKELVIRTAIEMGYRKLNKLPDKKNESPQINENRNICLLTHDSYIGNSFWSYIVKGLTEVLNDTGYNLVINMLSEEDEKEYLLQRKSLGGNMAGIVMIGVFSKEYVLRIQSEDIPAVFVDTLAESDALCMKGDVVMMDNEAGVYKLTTHLISMGHKRIGFVGDKTLCRSFLERWRGYKNAMEDAGLAIDESCCINYHSEIPYYSYAEVQDRIKHLQHEMPTAFVCANDNTAINLMKALKVVGLQVPEDVSLVGFDDIDEAVLITPNLTTVRCFKKEMGKRIGEEIHWRMKNPDRPYEIIRVSTEVVYRDSVKKIN